TVTPPLDVPLTDLDLSVDRFTTAAWRRAAPIHFAVALSGGSVALPPRRARSSLFAGIVASAASAVTGGDTADTRPRPLFDELRVDGDVQFYPLPEGHVRASLGAFELLALRGLAKPSGIDIGDGLLDVGVRVDLRGERGMDVQSTLVFTHLSVSEPPG